MKRSIFTFFLIIMIEFIFINFPAIASEYYINPTGTGSSESYNCRLFEEALR